MSYRSAVVPLARKLYIVESRPSLRTAPHHHTLITPIERISFDNPEKSFKLLSVLFDEFLSFKPHVDMLCNKISKSLYCLNRVKNFINSKSLRLLYF
jgi:hypothetical protein